MHVRIHDDGKVYVIEAPAGARVIRTTGEDCLIYRQGGRLECLLTPLAVLCARDNTRGLRLVSVQ